jgi:molybdopterin-guanine dinucleotide biosynthesis protein B
MQANKIPVPLIGFAACSGTGKTTLLCQVIPLLKAQGLRVGVIKHAHHHFDIDYPQKDSYKLRKSGAETILVASGKRTAIIMEHAEIAKEPSFEDALAKMPLKELDLLLVEGFKWANFPKIELHRQALNAPYLYPSDKNIIAIATDYNLDNIKNNTCSIIQLDLNSPQQIANFIVLKSLK